MDDRLPVPRQVRGGLPEHRRRVDVGGQAATRRGGRQCPPVGRLRDGDGGGRQVQQHRRPGQGGEVAGWHRNPHVLADLDVNPEIRDVGGGEDQVVSHRDQLPPAGDVDGGRQVVRARGEVTFLVELPVVGEVGLRDDAPHLAAVDHHGAVVEPVAQHHGGSDGEQRPEFRALPAQPGHGLVDGVQQRIVQQQVVDGVAADPQLGEGHHGHSSVVCLAHHLEGAFRVGVRGEIGDGQRRGRHPGEALGVGIEEVHAGSIEAGDAAPRGSGARG